MRRAPILIALGVAVLIAGLAIAQTTGSTPKRKVLHEELAAPSNEKTTPVIGATGSGNPTAFTAGNKVLVKPPVDRDSAASKGEPVYGKGGFSVDRKTEMKPDNKTGSDGTLHYISVFNPDVLPFKRMSVFDAVSDTYTFKIAHSALVEIPVGGTTDKTRDRFWGSLMIDLKPGKDVALPSVSPDMRILSYETKPSVRLKFEKDGTDNFYVRSDESSAAGSYRLVFLADADAGYFAPQLPTNRRYTANAVWGMAPPELKASLPDHIRKEANRQLQKLGIDADMDLSIAFNKLVAYFRAFSAKDPPPPSNDIYRDLCDSQAGVCRHRSFAFVVTAIALGIPTRYVENEAHAFVEVWFPERRWQRIDLGGAALELEVSGAENKTLHRPRADDPFAKPQEYKQNYTQLEGSIKGLTKQQIADKQKSLDQSPASGSFGSGAGGGSGGGASPNTITPDPTLPAVTMDPKKQSPRLTVTLADASAYRGDSIHVEGRVDVGGKGLPDHRIDVYLAPAGQNGKNSLPSLGHATTSPDGTFRADFPIPGKIDLATYEIFLSSQEDAYFNAALSN